MKGQFFAPILGLILFALAVSYSAYIIQGERTLSGLLSEFRDRIVYITYGEISLLDLQTSLESYIRNKFYDYLEGISISEEDVSEYVKTRIPVWVKEFFSEIERNLDDISIKIIKQPKVLSVGDAPLSGDYRKLTLALEPAQIEIKIRDIVIRKSFSLKDSIVYPYPTSLFKELKKLMENIEEAIEDLEVEITYDGVVEYGDLKNAVEELKGLANSHPNCAFSAKHAMLWLFEDNSVQFIPAEVTGFSCRANKTWVIPGLGKAITVKAGLERRVDHEILPEGNYIKIKNYAVKVDISLPPSDVCDVLTSMCNCQKEEHDGEYEWKCHCVGCSSKKKNLCNTVQGTLQDFTGVLGCS